MTHLIDKQNMRWTEPTDQRGWNPGRGTLRLMLLAACIPVGIYGQPSETVAAPVMPKLPNYAGYQFGEYDKGSGYQTPAGEVVYPTYHEGIGCSIMPVDDGEPTVNEATLFDTEWDMRVNMPVMEGPLVELFAFHTAILQAEGYDPAGEQVIGHCAFTVRTQAGADPTYHFTDALPASFIGDFTAEDGWGRPFVPGPQ